MWMHAKCLPCSLEQFPDLMLPPGIVNFQVLGFSTNMSHQLFIIQCSSQKLLDNTNFFLNVHQGLSGPKALRTMYSVN